MKIPLLALVLLPGLLRAAAPIPLEESVVIEAINDVTRITMPSGQSERAAPKTHLHSPDRLRTGRQSRAELEAPDGTITRLGANTLFAFDAATRTMRLEGGSLLFHSPTGRGGGTIRSSSASASVLGTTLIAAATPDGGFKLLVLEGRAQVDFARGPRQQLEAGQMTFVRPAGDGAGAPGPVLRFDLAQQVKNSRLVQGFARPLASAAKIEQAVKDQRRAVGQGQFVTTGFLVYAATSDTQVNGIEAVGPDADNNLVGEFTAHQRLALNTGATLQSSALPAERVFRTELLVPASESVFLKEQSDVLVTGLLGLAVVIDTPTLSLADWGPSTFHFVGKDSLTFTGSTRFTDLTGINYLRFFSPELHVPAGAALVADFPTASRGTTFYFDIDHDLILDRATVSNLTGGLILQTHTGSVRIATSTLLAGTPIGAETVVPSAINLDSRGARLDLSDSLVRTTDGGFAASGLDVTLSATRFELGGNLWTDAGGTARLQNLTFANQPAATVFQTTAVDLIEAQALRFTGFTEINLGARTLALRDVHFPAGSTVRLVSELGRLAPQPNTNQPVQPGFVNFVEHVTYADLPAQDFVPAAAGGAGQQPSRITVSRPGPQ